ncbi:MAG: class I SAM-dependent methyltransferase [Betaproteobacteria bacterium]|nr:class I SAM-dependent methyltransferase [Betaproteobacteria bacterium]
MNLHRLFAFAAVAALLSGPALAQTKDYQPQVGQQGKDVIWVPTPDEVVDRMLTMAQAKPSDYVVDLGAGDGKIAIAAAKKFGARSLGIEYNPEMAKHAQGNVEKAGVADKTRILQGDIFATDFKSATVVTMYLLPALNLKLRPTILAMKPGTRIVSHSFTMDDWEPDETSSMDGRRMFFWVVPASVQGNWKVSPAGGEAFDVTLEQRFQKLEGNVNLGPILGGLRETRLSGANIGFTIVDPAGVRRSYSGMVNGTTMEGAVRADNGTEGRWSAVRR